MPRLKVRRLLAAVALLAVSAACRDDGASNTAPAPSTSAPSSPPSTPAPSPPPQGRVVTTFESGGARLQVTEVARNLDTVWSLAWDPAGALWYTERAGRLTKLGEPPRRVAGVEEVSESGLMGLEIDDRGQIFVMYTSAQDNRVVALDAGGGQRVLVSGIEKASIHDGGRLRLGPDGALYATTGDAADPELAPRGDSLNGKILRLDPATGRPRAYSRGHRNAQGLCFAPDGRLLATEHGPSGRDEVNVITEGFDGGWPERAGNGIRNYTPAVAPAGCAVYSASLIPAWRGSMLFATLAGESLRRLTFGPGGAVAAEEVLLEEQLGRLRDVAVGPDGAVYLATSNRDGRGDPRDDDDRIVRIAPA